MSQKLLVSQCLLCTTVVNLHDYEWRTFACAIRSLGLEIVVPEIKDDTSFAIVQTVKPRASGGYFRWPDGKTFSTGLK